MTDEVRDLSTAEDVARGRRPDAIVIASSHSPDGKHAVVLVDKGKPGKPYVLQVLCERACRGLDDAKRQQRARLDGDMDGRPARSKESWRSNLVG
jgi:hypothetical protein